MCCCDWLCYSGFSVEWGVDGVRFCLWSWCRCWVIVRYSCSSTRLGGLAAGLQWIGETGRSFELLMRALCPSGLVDVASWLCGHLFGSLTFGW